MPKTKTDRIAYALKKLSEAKEFRLQELGRLMEDYDEQLLALGAGLRGLKHERARLKQDLALLEQVECLANRDDCDIEWEEEARESVL